MDASENIGIVVSFPPRTTCFDSVELALKEVVFIGSASQPIMFDEITVLCSAERRELPRSEGSTHTPFLQAGSFLEGFLQPNGIECDHCKVQTGLKGKHLCFARLH